MVTSVLPVLQKAKKATAVLSSFPADGVAHIKLIIGLSVGCATQHSTGHLASDLQHQNG